MQLIYQLMMGISLSAATGLRAWLPLLITAVMARSGHATLHPSFAFLITDEAIIIFAIATAVEIIGDLIPTVDHLLDLVHTAIRPAVATVITAGLLVETDPLTGTIIGLITGGAVSGGVHIVKAVGRTVSTAATFGFANALLSMIENIFSSALSLMAILAPLLVFFFTVAFLVLVGFIAIRLGKRVKGLIFRKRKRSRRRRQTPQYPALQLPELLGEEPWNKTFETPERYDP